MASISSDHDLKSARIIDRTSARSQTIAVVPSGDGAKAAAGAPKIAVFHDSFCQMGGAERFAEELHRALSSQGQVAMHSTVSADQILTPHLRQAKIRNTWMQWLPSPRKLFRAYFMLYPFAVESADLSEYDIIVSSCVGYAKGVRKRPASPERHAALHICYSHTPMRWVWRTEDYLAREWNGRLKAFLLSLPLRWLRSWEVKASRNPDLYVANSYVVARRLRAAFGVEATVIPPPIDTARFAPLNGHEDDAPEDFYLILSRLVPYKRYDLAIEACIKLGRRLVVIGDGTDRARLEALAAGNPNIRFLGRASDDVVVDYARRAKALLFPGEEDFGMTPLEVNAAGRPVVAFRAGGATETIVPGLNGVFFDAPSADSMAKAMLELESIAWDGAAIRAHAAKFDAAIFRERICAFVDAAVKARTPALPSSAMIMFPARTAPERRRAS